MKKFILISLVLFTFLSCSKEEGYGGLSSISGKIRGKNVNSNGVTINEDFIGDIKVYISKHNDPNYFDSKDSAYDGSFKFDFLQPGSYDVWVFGDCDSCAWAQVYKLQTVDIAKKEDKNIGNIVITF